LTNPAVKEFEIPEEIKKLGFTRVCIIGKTLIIYPTNSNPILSPFYSSEPLKTTKAVEKTLADRSIDKNTTKRFVTFLSEALLHSAEAEYEKENAETAQKQKEKRYILDEIKRLKDSVGEISPEKWKDGLIDRYHNLHKVVENNIPEIWPGLEFELSILKILNIEGCTLPFIGILLGKPSSGKTLVIHVLRKWPLVYYTDNFTARAFVSHSTAVASKEELIQVDMLPKMKNKLFLTPELSPTFTAKDEDLNNFWGL
jgi:hypothetical protein